MSKDVHFHEIVENYAEDLDLYTTAITRAHGKSHPEAFEVRELYEEMQEKLNQGDTDKPNLDEEFKQLREITDHYTVPGDVCETYAAVYNMLSELDEAYHA